jgi:hypothetical protein
MLHLWLNVATFMSLFGVVVYVTLLPYTTWFDE